MCVFTFLCKHIIMIIVSVNMGVHACACVCVHVSVCFPLCVYLHKRVVERGDTLKVEAYVCTSWQGGRS